MLNSGESRLRRRQVESPSIVLLAGPNGAGKTTLAPFLLRDALAVPEFVNADQIAMGLSAFHPESVALAAGRIMLARLDELAGQQASFGFETTLASRSFARWVRLRIGDGYAVHLVFLWLASPELAIARVAGRVARGGHAVADEVVRRRYAAGLRNFFGLYQALATTWRMYDTSPPGLASLIARGSEEGVQVADSRRWQDIMRQWS